VRRTASNIDNEMGSPHNFIVYVCLVKISRQVIMESILAWILLVLILWYILKPMYEDFQVKASNLWLDRLTGEFEMLYLTWTQLRVIGAPILSLTPFTCPKNKPDLDAGLCYEKCREGYHGVGPVCWADTHNRGVGTPVLPEDCPPGYTVDSALTCSKPVQCSTYCDGNWSWSDGGFCHTKCEGGLLGRLDKGGQCTKVSDIPKGEDPSNYYTDKKDGLCYKPCPKDKSSTVAGMPYLCYNGGDLSYGRGVGVIPHLFQILGGSSYETNIL
jgi:hypothetical protein